jgi:hypothetical protein
MGFYGDFMAEFTQQQNCDIHGSTLNGKLNMACWKIPRGKRIVPQGRHNGVTPWLGTIPDIFLCGIQESSCGDW